MKRPDATHPSVPESVEGVPRTRVDALLPSKREKERFLAIRQRLLAIINTEEPQKDEVIDDMVQAAADLLLKGLTYAGFITFGVTLLVKYRRMKKLRKLIALLLGKIFDPSLDFRMDIADVRRACNACNLGELTGRDYQLIYDVVIERLESGPIREKCLTTDIVIYVNRKICEIKDSLHQFVVGSTRPTYSLDNEK